MSRPDSVNIIALFHNFYRYRRGVSLIFILILVATFLYIKQVIPIYSSSMLISIKHDDSSNSSLFQTSRILNIDMNGQLEYDTKILKSRYIISKVLDKIDFSKRFFLRREWRDRELYAQEIPFEVDFNTTVNSKPLKFMLKPIDKESFMLKNLKFGSVAESYKYGQIIKHDSYFLKINKRAEPTLGMEYRVVFNNNRNHLIKDILNNLNIEKQANKLLNISYEDQIPSRAKDVVSQLVKSYKEYNLDSKQLDDVNNITFLDKVILELGATLKKISDKIREYKTQNSELLSRNAENKFFSNIITKEQRIKELSLKLNALNSTEEYFKKGIYSVSTLENFGIRSEGIKQLIDKLKKENSQLKLFNKQKKSSEDLIISDIFYSNLLKEQNKNQAELRKLLLEYTDEFPKVIEIEERINRLREEMRNYVNNHINIYSQEQRADKKEISKIVKILIDTVEEEYLSMKESIKKDKESIEKIPKAIIKLEELERTFELNENNYKRLLQKRSEASISKGSTISNIYIVDIASESTKPVKPKKAFLLLSATVLWLVLATLYSSFSSFRDKIIYSEDDILLDDYTLIYDKNRKMEDTLWRVVTKLEERDTKSSQIVLVTSSGYSENKSAIVKQLSLALEEIEKKVLIIDFDLQNPQISQEIKRVSDIGVTNILTSRHDLSEIELSDYINYINSGYKNVDILRSGPIVPNSSSLMFNSKIKTMLEQLSKKYDYILMDSIPIGVDSTIDVLFEHIDTLLFVAKIGKTDSRAFKKLNEFKKKNKNMDKLLFLTDSN